MPVKFDGFDEFHKSLKNISDNIEKNAGEREVSLDDLFTKEFMNSCSEYNTFNELLDAGGFDSSSQEAFEAIPDEEIDVFIKENTNYDSWEDMLGSANDEYIAKLIGF